MENSARNTDDGFNPEVRLVKTIYEDRLRDERNRGLAVAGLAGLTLLLASLGIFSVVSYGVTLRRKEIGIRLALGAGRRSIARLLMKNLMKRLHRDGDRVGRRLHDRPGDRRNAVALQRLRSLPPLIARVPGPSDRGLRRSSPHSSRHPHGYHAGAEVRITAVRLQGAIDSQTGRFLTGGSRLNLSGI
jgi:hypothetical protein